MTIFFLFYAGQMSVLRGLYIQPDICIQVGKLCENQSHTQELNRLLKPVRIRLTDLNLKLAVFYKILLHNYLNSSR